MSGGRPPAGYVQVHAARWRCAVTTLAEHADDALALLASGTLHEAASHMAGARALEGRETAYAITLPVTRVPAVVRHNRHGGMFAPLTRDLFLWPTRAPYELRTALALRDRGVRTPNVLMYGVQSVRGPWRRADVMTREVEHSRDLSSYMMPQESEVARRDAWAAAHDLLQSLVAAGARHHDLNVKNVLLAPTSEGVRAWVLDVDRVELCTPGDARVGEANQARLLRSARKWRDERGAVFDERQTLALLRSE